MVSTAYLDEAERCSRVALMYQGKFIRIGEPREVRMMIGEYLLEILCDRPREAEEVLRTVKEYRKIIRSGESLRIFVGNAQRYKKAIESLLKAKGITVREIRTIAPSLEDTFVEVIVREESLS